MLTRSIKTNLNSLKILFQLGRNDQGFIALVSILLITSGITALSFSALSAAAAYSDSIFRREERIQHSLDLEACADSAKLIKAKDVFALGTIHLNEFDCDINL